MAWHPKPQASGTSVRENGGAGGVKSFSDRLSLLSLPRRVGRLELIRLNTACAFSFRQPEPINAYLRTSDLSTLFIPWVGPAPRSEDDQRTNNPATSPIVRLENAETGAQTSQGARLKFFIPFQSFS